MKYRVLVQREDGTSNYGFFNSLKVHNAPYTTDLELAQRTVNHLQECWPENQYSLVEETN